MKGSFILDFNKLLLRFFFFDEPLCFPLLLSFPLIFNVHMNVHICVCDFHLLDF